MGNVLSYVRIRLSKTIYLFLFTSLLITFITIYLGVYQNSVQGKTF